LKEIKTDSLVKGLKLSPDSKYFSVITQKSVYVFDDKLQQIWKEAHKIEFNGDLWYIDFSASNLFTCFNVLINKINTLYVFSILEAKFIAIPNSACAHFVANDKIFAVFDDFKVKLLSTDLKAEAEKDIRFLPNIDLSINFV